MITRARGALPSAVICAFALTGLAPAERRDAALASIAILDGLLLLRRLSGARTANAAARAIGIG